ncbi:MAG: mycothiol conjugate amidase Mca [Dactylosporangium sp.]|nr:mycothiol conjugate amidase Mca [Dactylosporangium sp.]NNJ63389.1 mycothiol conjugate amidase Mca [Dactylosporangium sp.]
MGKQLRLMAVHAHPDDESSKGAATMVKYLAEGVDVVVVTCTGGERGRVLNPRLDRPETAADLPAIRQAEMTRARQILGVRQEWLGFVDSGLPEGDPVPPLPEGCFAGLPLAEAATPLVRLVRRLRPHVLLTYDERGGYPHPDHVMCHRVSVEAFDAAGDPDRYVGTGEPWQPLKLYYHMTLSPARIRALHDAVLAAGLTSPYDAWLAAFQGTERASHEITTRVACDDYFPARDAALRAHATQVDPTGHWFAVPRELERAVWPTEDYALARSLVQTTLPESDLFAGIRECARV